MKIQTLVSTMYQKNQNIYKKMNINTDAVIINQCNCDKESKIEIKNGNSTVSFINSNQRGLSKSRNKAIQHASGDICILADDDLVYLNSAENTISDIFKDNPDIDIITFQVEGINRPFKKYKSKAKKLNYISCLKISSVEIAFRLKSIKSKNISFNEDFGSGSKYIMGEENIFLYDCLKSGLKIKYIPIKIANLYIGDSTWFKGYNRKYFESRGANYTAMTKLFSILLILQFSIRHYNKYSDQVSILNAIKYMLEGRYQYMKTTKKGK